MFSPEHREFIEDLYRNWNKNEILFQKNLITKVIRKLLKFVPDSLIADRANEIQIDTCKEILDLIEEKLWLLTNQKQQEKQ